MLSKVLYVIFIVPMMFISSCTFYNEETYFEDVPCDSNFVNRDTIVVYYTDLTPIFSGICLQCHNSQFTYRQGIRMDDYALVKKSFETGLVWAAINHTGTYKMPKNLPKLSDCEIQQIGAWWSAGMPEKEVK